MSKTITNFLNSLLESITTYYTATYSSDTDLYQILRMYGAELTSGSVTLETVRNNAYIVLCENSNLFNNFGTYFNQLKSGDQDYNEDLYTSGKVTQSFGPTASSISQETTTSFITDWEVKSTPFPCNFYLGTSGPPHFYTIYGYPLYQTTATENKLYATCYATSGSIARIVSYNISTNEWQILPTVLADIAGSAWATFLTNPVIPTMGLVLYTPYTSRGTFGEKHLYCFDISPSQYSLGMGYNKLSIVGVKYSNLDAVPTYSSGSIFDAVNLLSLSFTEGVDFHNKIYMGIAATSIVEGSTQRWPHLIYYDCGTDTVGETSLAATIKASVIDDFDVYVIVVHSNKIYLEIIHGTSHMLVTYDGISCNVSLTSPATGSEVVRDMISYNDALYAIVYDSSSNTSKIYTYTIATDTWTLQYTFTSSAYKFYIFNSYLIISLAQGYIYYLDSTGTWKEHSQISVVGNRAASQFEFINNSIYALVPFDVNEWSSNSFITSNTYRYYYTGDKKIFTTDERVSIPSYRKQLDFLLEASVNSGTRLGITRTVDAFTLVNPDIRELYRFPGWKLKITSGSVERLSTNIWQFNVANWKDNLWVGAHATFTSGSGITDKAAAGYMVLVNDNNTITSAPIYDNNLLYNLRRP